MWESPLFSGYCIITSIFNYIYLFNRLFRISLLKELCLGIEYWTLWKGVLRQCFEKTGRPVSEHFCTFNSGISIFWISSLAKHKSQNSQKNVDRRLFCIAKASLFIYYEKNGVFIYWSYASIVRNLLSSSHLSLR